MSLGGSESMGIGQLLEYAIADVVNGEVDGEVGDEMGGKAADGVHGSIV